MPSLFDSETDVPEERKVLKRTLSAQKITFILTALCAVIYLLQNIGFEEPIIDLFHYPAYSWEDTGSMALFHPCYCSFVGTPYFI